MSLPRLARTTPRRYPVLYADVPARRALQIVADTAFLGAVVAAVQAGSAVERALAEPAHSLRESTISIGSFSERLGETAERITDVPLLGDRIAGPLDSVSGAADRVSETADSLSSTLLTAAHQVGLLVLLSLAATAVLFWLPFRLRFAVRATSISRLMDQPAAEDLLATRAFATASLPQLAQVPGVESWRSADRDPRATRALAELAVRPYGLRFRSAPQIDRKVTVEQVR